MELNSVVIRIAQTNLNNYEKKDKLPDNANTSFRLYYILLSGYACVCNTHPARFSNTNGVKPKIKKLMEIKIGNTYKVKDNLWKELQALGFDKQAMMFYSHSMVGTHQKVIKVLRFRPSIHQGEIPTKENMGYYAVTENGHFVPLVCFEEIEVEKIEESVEEIEED